MKPALAVAIHVVPMKHLDANEFVRRLHRHSRPTLGALFCVGVSDEQQVVRGVAIVGRPVARRLDDGSSAEILRVATDGVPNACSILYGACRRIAREMGYARLFTYTLPEEGGASLRGAGFVLEGEAGGPSKGWYTRYGRTVMPIGDDLVGGKWRWIWSKAKESEVKAA